jgi:hypothetical protein
MHYFFIANDTVFFEKKFAIYKKSNIQKRVLYFLSYKNRNEVTNSKKKEKNGKKKNNGIMLPMFREFRAYGNF